METKLRDLETTISKIWPEIADGFVDLSHGTLRRGLSLFVAVMHLRNPETRRSVEDLHHQFVDIYESAPRWADGSPRIESVEVGGIEYELDPRGWREYRAWGKNDHDRMFAQTVEMYATHIAKLIMRKRWSVVFSKEDTFITSDKPVVLQHRSKSAVGFATPDALITFPLSPRRILLLDDRHEEPANQYYPLSRGNAGAFNYNIWAGSSRFMITGRPVPEVLAEIVALADSIEGT